MKENQAAEVEIYSAIVQMASPPEAVLTPSECNIVACFEEITDPGVEGWNRDTAADACSYLRAMIEFQFIITLHVSKKKRLAYLKGLMFNASLILHISVHIPVECLQTVLLGPVK